MLESTMVTISMTDYKELLEDQRLLTALQAAGVDNWEGYSYALEIFHEDEEVLNDD